jgi:hypothetical protein
MGRTWNVANIDQLLRRKKDFAATGAHEAAPPPGRSRAGMLRSLA